MPAYDLLQKPALTPPAIVFPIVWSVLYLLMAVGSALVYLSDAPGRSQALTVYVFQLAVNLIWSFLFFGFGAYRLSFFLLLLLIILVAIMIGSFYRVSKPASLLQIPYFLWLILAAYLNLAIWFMN